MNKVFRQNQSYIVLCTKHDNLRKLKSLLKFVWRDNVPCSVCGKRGD